MVQVLLEVVDDLYIPALEDLEGLDFGIEVGLVAHVMEIAVQGFLNGPALANGGLHLLIHFGGDREGHLIGDGGTVLLHLDALVDELLSVVIVLDLSVFKSKDNILSFPLLLLQDDHHVLNISVDDHLLHPLLADRTFPTLVIRLFQDLQKGLHAEHLNVGTVDSSSRHLDYLGSELALHA